MGLLLAPTKASASTVRLLYSMVTVGSCVWVCLRAGSKVAMHSRQVGGASQGTGEPAAGGSRRQQRTAARRLRPRGLLKPAR